MEYLDELASSISIIDETLQEINDGEITSNALFLIGDDMEDNIDSTDYDGEFDMAKHIANRRAQQHTAIVSAPVASNIISAGSLLGGDDVEINTTLTKEISQEDLLNEELFLAQDELHAHMSARRNQMLNNLANPGIHEKNTSSQFEKNTSCQSEKNTATRSVNMSMLDTDLPMSIFDLQSVWERRGLY